MDVDSIKRRKFWLISGIVFVFGVILAVSLGFLIYGRIFSARVSVMVAPSIATVKIGDNTYNAFGEHSLQPGEYTVEVSADGFETKTGKLVAQADQTVKLNLYLDSNSPETADWYEKNSGDALIVGEIQNNEMLEKVDEIMQREPVLSSLPLTVEYYSDDLSEYTKYVLSYAVNDSERGFYLIMKDYTNVGMMTGIRKLEEMGMSTVGVELKYENLSDDSLSAKAEE